jgi:hypothetical protein
MWSSNLRDDFRRRAGSEGRVFLHGQARLQITRLKKNLEKLTTLALLPSHAAELPLAAYVQSLGALSHGDRVMLRKTIIALMTVASVGMLAPTVVSARGGGGGGGGGGHGGGGGFGGGGGGFHGGGFGGGGFGGGGFRGGGFGGGAFRAGAMAGRGFRGGDFHRGFGHRFGYGYGPYYDYGYYDYDYPYYGYGYGYPYYGDSYYNDSYYDNGDCRVVQRRVHTKHGSYLRPVQVCG